MTIAFTIQAWIRHFVRGQGTERDFALAMKIWATKLGVSPASLMSAPGNRGFPNWIFWHLNWKNGMAVLSTELSVWSKRIIFKWRTEVMSIKRTCQICQIHWIQWSNSIRKITVSDTVFTTSHVLHPNYCLKLCYKIHVEYGPASMLAGKRMAGVPPQVNLRECDLHMPLSKWK